MEKLRTLDLELEQAKKKDQPAHFHTYVEYQEQLDKIIQNKRLEQWKSSLNQN